ncbi:MAG: family 10 glycosylhydrolase [Bacilli bacterium]|nr:family 10 glycosylhydrolase [Bacilli bacterium]
MMKRNILNIRSVFLKTLLILIVVLCLFVSTSKSSAKEGEEVIVINGEPISYRDGGYVYINQEHSSAGGEFRGVWVSPLTGDISTYTQKSSYQAQMLDVLKNMEVYNLNVLIFHVRIMNDALYESKYNNWSSYYSTTPDWDMLPWLIEECHKRGIEFHAWMNPYRVTTNVSLSLEECASRYPKTNAASKVKNLLKADKTIILNPGIPEVQRFLVNTCMELIENYDVDAIHFDDYFYAAGIDDSETIREYNTKGLSKADFRRSAVDAFIESLSNEMRAFNERTGRRVQLGIAPTGVWKNGNGVVTYDDAGNAVSTGSKTSAYAHYGDPLYADTLKWINNGWIDYMLPQTYWAITNSAGPYCDLVKWWNAACKNSKTNLYSSLGLYMSSGGNASWSTNPLESYQQIMYANTLPYVRGSSIYNYNSYVGAISNPSKAFKNVNKIWSKAIYLPEIRTMDRIVPNKVTGLSLDKNEYGVTLRFDEASDAKFYVIYRSEKEITFDEEEIIDVIGNVGHNGKIEYTDCDRKEGKTYYYGVKAQSHSLTLGEGVKISPNEEKVGSNAYLGDITNVSLNSLPVENGNLTVKFDSLDYPFGTNVKYEAKIYFYNLNNEIKRSTLSVNEKNRLCLANFSIPEGCTQLTIEIKAYNNCGESNITKSYDVYRDLGLITNFGIIQTDGYFGSNATFIWNNKNDSNISYSIEYSFDDFEYYPLEKIENIDLTSFNISYKTKLYDEESNSVRKVYYRIKAETNEAISYSNPVDIMQHHYLGPIYNLRVNDERQVKELDVEEGDTITITWSDSNSNAVYTVLVSYDGENFVGLSSYNPAAYTSLNGSTYECKLPIRYSHFLIYLRVEATYQGSKTVSDIIKVNIQIDELFSDEVAKYLYDTYHIFLNGMNIYN